MRALVFLAAAGFVIHAPAAQPAATGTITGSVVAMSNGQKAPLPVGGLWVFLIDENRDHTRDPKWNPTASIVQTSVNGGSPYFDPHVLVVPRGTVVAFPHLDRGHKEHNVFSPTPELFDLKRQVYGAKPTKVFDMSGGPPRGTLPRNPAPEVEIYCDIHPCMWAHVKVVDVLRPDFIQPVAKDGTYTFTNVPPGTYEVYAWAVASIEVGSGTFKLKAGQRVTLVPHNLQLGTLDTSHKNKRGDPYDSTYTGCR